MRIEDIIRAWKDDRFRRSLTEEELSLLPENPAGLIELSDPELNYVAGGVTAMCTRAPRCNTQLCESWNCGTDSATICGCESLSNCPTESSACGNTYGFCSADADCTYAGCTATGCSFGVICAPPV